MPDTRARNRGTGEPGGGRDVTPRPARAILSSFRRQNSSCRKPAGGNSADGQNLVFVRTDRSGRAGPPDHNPGDRVLPGDSLEVRELKTVPASLGLDLSLPSLREAGKQRHRPTVLDRIGEDTSLGN